MRIAVIGGGPSGLYFAILMKRADPGLEVVVHERNRPDDTFGFGVVFSDATLVEVRDADPDTYAAITDEFVHWDDIDVHFGGETIRTTGHGFSGMSRQTLLRVLQGVAQDLGVDLRFESEIEALEAFADFELVVGADGVNSGVRDLLGSAVGPSIDERPNRFVWLGTTKPFPAFTFYFRENEHGLWRVHAYQYEPGRSTFIVECTEETWQSAGLDSVTEEETLAFCEELFAEELEGHPLIANRSVWRAFPTIRCARWSSERTVLIGDAAHTAHFSIGSGTRLGMLDGIALRDALMSGWAEHGPRVGSDGPTGDSMPVSVSTALEAYEALRRPPVESLQRAAQASLEWFEATERYMALDPVQFCFTLLTRSLRITHEDLRIRDADFLRRVDAGVAARAEGQTGMSLPAGATTPPMFTPFKLRELILPNRIAVSPMCQYCADDGAVGDWHFQHLASRAVGGAGLVIAEMTDVSAEGRISPGCAGLYRPEHVDAWKRIVDFVHRETPAGIGVQLGHAGRKGSTRPLWEGDSEPLEDGEWPLISASPIPYFPDRSQMPREMTRADMDAVLEEYVTATGYAEAAGFDLLEVHMAHGYLLASFVSPLTNLRDDEYGGTVENRMRFPLEIFEACRAAWPAHKPMSARISAEDWAPGGIDVEDVVTLSRLLRQAGCDAVDVSSAGTVHDQSPVWGRLFQSTLR